MSRTLSKILVICAMVAVFPLMIVGSVFASYFSVEANLAVEVYVNAYSQSEDAYARIDSENQTLAIEKIGQNDKKEEISKGHLSEINLTANSKGYTFEGWFVGDSKEYALAHQNGTVELIKNSTLNFVISDYEKLTAVFNIVEYSVEYNYESTPGSEVEKTVSAKYGDELLEIEYNGPEYKFAGWKLAGDESNQIYEVANFDESTQNVVLEAVWVEQPKFEVKYFDGDEELEVVSNIYNETEHSILAIADVVSAERMKNGYTYSWQDAEGNAVTGSYEVTENMYIYLKEEEIKYSAQLLTTGTNFNGYTEAIFGVESNSSIQAWFNVENWSAEYSYNQINGLKVGETTYDISEEGLSDFVSDVVESNPTSAPETAVEIEVIVDEYFTTFAISDGITFGTSGIDTDVYLFGEGIALTGLPGKRSMDSSKTVYELLNLKNGDTVVKLYNANDEEVSLRCLIINGISIEVEGSETLNEIINKMYNDSRFGSVELDEEFTVNSIRAHFE